MEDTAERTVGPERLMAFSDGVFAIAITLLILDIKFPDNVSIITNADFIKALEATLPQLLAYFFSFLIIGQYWLLHHAMFSHIKSINDTLLGANLIFLLFVSFAPFPTKVISEHGNVQLSLIFYAISLTICRLIATWMWLYVIGHPKLTKHDLSSRQSVKFILRSLNSPLVFVVSIAISFFSLEAAYISWGSIALVSFALRWVLSERHKKEATLPETKKTVSE